MNPNQVETKLKVAKDRLVHKLKAVQDQLSQEPRPQTLALNINLRQLQNCQERVNKLREDLEKAVLTVNDKEVTKKFDEEIIEYETLNLDCEDAIATISAICEDEQKTKKEPNTPEKNVMLMNPYAGMKLPELPKTTFSGDITTYREFKQDFNVTIGSSELSDNRKLAYLKTMCVKKAENDLKGLPTTNENYTVAWKLLDEKYGDSKRTIDVLYKKITNLPKATSSTVSLRQVYDEMEVTFRTLESLHESFNDNTILFTTVKDKYPKEIVYEIHQNINGALTLTEFRTRLKAVIQKREELNFDTEVTETEPSTFTTEALMVKTNNTKKPTQKCIFCSSEKHWSDECDKMKTLASRKDNIKGRCFICLRKGHTVKECTTDRVCVHCGQKKNHHRSLCPKLFEDDSTQHSTQQQSADDNTDEKPKTTVSCLLSDREQNWLLTAVTSIINPENGKHLDARIVLDGGSKRTFIIKKAAEDLNLPTVSKEKLIIDTVGDRKQQELLSNIVQFQIKTRTGELISIEANTIGKIIDDVEPFNPEQLPDTSVLRDKILADTSNLTDVQILIGIDHLYDILTSEILRIGDHQYLLSSKLGWLFTGKLTTTNQKKNKVSCLLLKTIQADTNNDLKCLWELDTLGIKDTPDMNSNTAQKIFDDTVKYADNRYEVSWPWVNTEPDLKPNYGLALSRLESLVKKSSYEFLENYDAVFQEYLNEGIIELVDDSQPAGNVIHYLPHHGVRTESKSTPLHPVFDGSAKQGKDKSLNDCLYRGDNLNELIAALLLAFQMFEYGIISDIRRAFLQLVLAKNDRDAVRFLWLKNVKLKTTKDNIILLRFCRILFGASASPFLLSAAIRHHLKKYPTSIAFKLLKALYVDNMVTGADSLEEATKLIESCIQIFSDASMTLRQWQTNNRQLVEIFPKIGWIEDAVVSVLGLNWNTTSDTYTIKATTFDTTIATKRSILKNSAKIYDPLGYFSAVILKAKLILRQLWQENLDWDQPVSSEVELVWQEVVGELEKIQLIEIPRKLPLPPSSSSIQLHVFSDASKNAYGAMVYIRMENATQIATKLLFSKSKVAPLNSPLKIPRLELLAALIGARALKFVEESLHNCKIDKRFLWSDSKCVIAWVQSKKMLSLWVEKRATEIRKINQLSINYVKSEDNPADIASRGATVEDLTELWWQGPAWLKENESSWPVIKVDESEEFRSELRSTTLLTTDNNTQPPKPPADIKIEDFTHINKLLLQTVTQQKTSTIQANIETAKQAWIKYVQEVNFADEIEHIKQEKDPKTKLEKQLNPVIDEHGLLRVKGRLSNLLQATNDEFPVLLPKHNHFVQLLIMDTHKNLYHAGVSQTLSEIRKQYWLLGGRRAVYNVLQRCKNCKVFNGPAYKYPILPPLPGYRLKREAAFSHTGVDVLGPLYVRKQKASTMKKIWICLFTCLITRAVHLEIIEDMTSEELLTAFRCMFARRGIPRFILSDNAPQFNLLKSLLENGTQCNLKKTTIEWKQITEFSPWSGGIYEEW